MLKTMFIILFFYICSVFAQEIKVEIDPESPAVGESVSVYFSVEGDNLSDPNFNFDYAPLKLLGTGATSSKTSAAYVNGQFSRKTEITQTYYLQSDKEGLFHLKNIQANIAGKVLTHKDVAIHFSKGSSGPSLPSNNLRRNITPSKDENVSESVFLMPVVSKNEVYVGEGIDLDYYIYFNKPLAGLSAKEYPKLEGLIKRYKGQQAPQEESVDYNGYIYKRIALHSLKVFAQDPGPLTLGPMEAEVNVVETASSRSFFSFGFPRYRPLLLKSSPLEIKVKDFPQVGKPSSFSGLVGEHSFQLSVNRSKVLVGDVIEASLTVEGPGLLEEYDAPSLYDTQYLDEFDIKSEFIETISGAKKTFNYTYLAKENGEILARDLVFTYLNPQSKQYEEKRVSVPGLLISGGVNKVDSSLEADPISQVESNEEIVLENQGSFFRRVISYFNYIIIFVLLFFFILYLYRKIKNRKSKKELEFLKLQDEIKQMGPSYWSLYKLFSVTTQDDIEGAGLKAFEKTSEYSLIEMIEHSDLSQNAKEYFKNLGLQGESGDYKGKKEGAISFEYKEAYFKELYKILKRKNENYK